MFFNNLFTRIITTETNTVNKLLSIVTIRNIRKCHTETAQNVLENNIHNQKLHPNTKLLKVAIIGKPNAGKSTLINNLMNRKVCPASNKVHTTRKKSHVVLTEYLTQIVFLDTPGIVSDAELKKYNLEKSFKNDCTSSLNESDIIGVIHDVSNTWTQHRLDIKIIKLLERYDKKKCFLVLNKIDTLKSKRKLLDLVKTLTDCCLNDIPFTKNSKNKSEYIKGWSKFSDIFMISALMGDGVTDIKNYLLSQAKPSKFLYPENVWSNHSPDDIILRTVQATLLDFLPQEIPYRLKSTIELFEIDENGKINAIVLVQCPVERIKKLVIGVGDGKLRQITEKAQKDLLYTFDQNVRLEIVVTVNK